MVQGKKGFKCFILAAGLGLGVYLSFFARWGDGFNADELRGAPKLLIQFEEPYEYDEKFAWEEEVVDEVFYSSTSLNIRGEPRVESSTVGSFGKGEKVHVISTVKGSSWVKVDKKGKIGYCNSNYLTKDEPNISMLSETGYVDDSPIVVTGSVPESVLNAVKSNWATIQGNVRQAIKNNGWTIEVTSNDYASPYGYSVNGILALTVYNNKVSYIGIRKGSASATIHEVGHIVDSIHGYPSSGEEFTNIWGSEKDSFASAFSTHSSNYNSTGEYFAEAFWRYVTSSESLKNNCPSTFVFISNLCSSM